MTSRKNHYVPEWYQVGFATPGSNNWFVDISPPQSRPDGSPIVPAPRPRSPKSCFWEKDLYVTRFGELFNDQVETVLFQGIDDFGAKVVRTLIDGGRAGVPHDYESLFSYMGAQKLRTPKGLDWIRSRYPSLSKVELMVELQHLRQMFGTLWAESVREVVSAEDSEVKFLISDHPVTTFNAALALDAPALSYPSDATIVLNGTQTLFALNANHCLILTHLPYAKAPDAVPMLRKRINARHFGTTLIHAAGLIRERRMTADEVIAINHVLKQRATRYLAAGQADWLYPERQAPYDAQRTAKVLLPPDNKLFHFGGEVYIGYADGTHGYHDEYGRTSKEHEFVAKTPPKEPPEPDDPCPCGRGGTFGACCRPLDPAERPAWDLLSLRERNLGLIRAVMGILELQGDKDWIQVRRDLSDEQVVRIHRVVQLLWPEDTDFTELLPSAKDGRSRAIFVGPSDPRTVAESVVSLVPLFDQVLVLNPFLNARHMAGEFSPLHSPGAHKQNMLKNVCFLLLLAPLIESNKVVLFPDPSEVNRDFGRTMQLMAEERAAYWREHPQNFDQLKWLGRDDFERSVPQLPDSTLRSTIRKASPELSVQAVSELMAYMRKQAEVDPFALLQTRPEGEAGSHFIILRSVNLELALFMTQLTGALIVTDVTPLWEHLHVDTRALKDGAAPPVAVPYRAYIHPEDALTASQLPAAKALRAAIQDLPRNVSPGADATLLLLGVGNEFMQNQLDLADAASHPELVVPMTLTLSVPPRGFESATAQRLSVAFGRDGAPSPVPLAIFRRSVDAPPSDAPPA